MSKENKKAMIKTKLILSCCGSKLYKNEICKCNSIIIIQKFMIGCMRKLRNLPPINYNKYTITYGDINSFIVSDKESNDKNNKIRENVIGSIINNKIPQLYDNSKRWRTLRDSTMNYIHSLSEEKIIINTVSCKHKGGRKFNYDFNIIINSTLNYNVELKFNATRVSDAPQFISLGKPSQYLSASFEEYYYDTSISKLAEYANICVPNRDTYLREVHSSTPKCMELYKLKYKEDFSFELEAKRLSKQAITTFINNNDTELDIHKLSEKLMTTQKNKIYMLYDIKNKRFHKEIVNIDEYILVSYEKQPDKYRYVATSKTGNKINILLRWKNGNGIAFPAFQIS